MRILAVLLGLFSAGGTAQAQQDSRPLTKNWVRSVPPEAVSRRLFGELAPIMLPVPDRGQRGVRPTRPLRSLAFYTVPRAGPAEGICETDFVGLSFDPAGPDQGADTPVRPRRIRSTQVYFVYDRAALRRMAPREEGVRIAPREGRIDGGQDRACAAADPRDRQTIAGANFQVVAALRLFLDFGDALRVGPASAPLDCSALSRPDEPLSEAQCHAAFARLDPDRVDSVEACQADSAGGFCYRVG